MPTLHLNQQNSSQLPQQTRHSLQSGVQQPGWHPVSSISPQPTYFSDPSPNASTSCSFKRREHVALNKNTLWRIEGGVVRTSTWDESGNVIPLGFWGAGAIVGQPLSRIEPYQIECLTEVQATNLPSDYCFPLQTIISHVQQMEELLRIMHSGSIEKRLMRFLIWIADRFGNPSEKGHIIRLRLTHQEIADVIGTSRVTATRLLGKFQQEGIVSWSKHRHILLNADHSFDHMF